MHYEINILTPTALSEAQRRVSLRPKAVSLRWPQATVSLSPGAPGRLIDQCKRAAAFTLIEVLVVLAIIVLLIAILVPAAILAERYAYSSATQGDLAAIGQALSVYHSDFNMYPDSDLCYPGATPVNLYKNAPGGGIGAGNADQYLTECLLGYLPAGTGNDNGDGYGPVAMGGAVPWFPADAGFTMAPYKKVYGPYMPTNAQNLVFVPSNPGTNDGNYYFSGDFPPTAGVPLPILYFSATQSPIGPIPGQAGGIPVFGGAPGAGIFCYADDGANIPSKAQFFQLIGVKSPDTANGNTWNNAVGGTIMGHDSYLLVAPGPSQVVYGGDSLVYGGQ
ncbi:MAG: type II secretion system protein [Phycisphaerae bacterium]